MRKEHHIIYVPGLNDQNILNRNLAKLIPFYWHKFSVTTHIIAPHWEEGDSFGPKLKLLLREVDALIYHGHIITIVGQSAGGSAAMNAFCERRNMIHKVVNITGRLNRGDNVNPSLEQVSKNSRAFRESVLLFEKVNEPTLKPSDREKCLTIRPFWDEAVPSSTVSIKGATNLVAPFPEHTLGGILIGIFYASKIFNK